MAYPFQQPEGLTQDQAEILRELNSFQQVSDSVAWKKVIERLKGNTAEALEEMLGCAPDTPLEQRGVLQMRWQQREAIQRDLLSFVDAQLNERQKLIEEIKEQIDEHNPGDPGTDNQ